MRCYICAATNLSSKVKTAPTKKVDNMKRQFILPTAYKDNNRVVEYLRLRKISDFIIDYCIENELLYESADYHNAVFVGYDKEGVARYAALRGTWKHMTNSFKGEVAGSDKLYSFSVPSIEKSDKLIVTESAIDALSVATIRKKIGDVHYLSVGGIYIPRLLSETLPKALEQYLDDYKKIKSIELCFDNDEVGALASRFIGNKLLDEGYKVVSHIPEQKKDYNEYLLRE